MYPNSNSVSISPYETPLQFAETKALGRYIDPWFDAKYISPTIQRSPILNSTPPTGNRVLELAEARQALLREKLFTTFQGGALRFLPMDDGVTEETPEMRSEYIRILLKEPSVKSAMMSKIIAVVSSKMSMIPAGEDPINKRVSKWVENVLTRAKGGVRKIGENILLFALTNGHALNEKVYEVAKTKEYADWFPHGYIGLKQLKIKKPEDYKLEVDQFRNIRGVWSNRASRRFDPSYFVISSFMPMYENPAGTSDLRSAIRAYNLILMAQHLRALWTEQFSMPIMAGEYPEGNNDAKAFVEAAIQSVRALGWYVAPAGVTLKVIDVATRGQAEFQEMIDDLRKEIYLCIVGSYLQAIEGDTQGGAGNSETHRTTFELFQWYLCEFLAEQINDQIIPDLIGMNFSGLETPRVSFAGVNDGDLLQSASVYQAIKGLGLDLSKKKIRQKFELDQPEDEEDTIYGDNVKPGQQQPGMGGLGDLFGGGGGDENGPKPQPTVKQPNEQKKDDTGLIKPLTAMKLSEGMPMFANGPKILWKAMQFLDKVILSDVALSREMCVGEDGLTDYGTMMRTAKYHGVFYHDIPEASVFDLEDDINDPNRLALTTMELEEGQPASFVIIAGCNLKKGSVKVITPDGSDDLDPETFLSQWPGNGATRRIVMLSLKNDEKPKEGETPPEPSKHSEGDDDEEEGGDGGSRRDTSPGSGVGPRKPVDENDIPAGPDGRDVYKLLNLTTKYGSDVVTEMAKKAAARMLKSGNTDEFFNEGELEKLADALENSLAPADLLGRASVLIRLEKARKFSDTVVKFSEQPCGLPETFAEGRLAPMKPAKALDYFKSLVPSMNLNVQTWGDSLRRKTFTMAEASNKAILRKVKKIIERRVANGDTITGATAIEDILSRAGIHPRNPQYCDMVFRTNYMEMFNVAAEEQRLDPDIVDEFPVWRYMGIRDGRQGKDHEVHFNKYYPAKAKFGEVRGERVFNCVLPGNEISGRFTAALKASYSGEAVEILTRNGSRISLTINHPVFTENGLIKAGDLHKGLNLWTYCGNSDASTGIDVDNAPPTIEKVFDSFKSSRKRKRLSRFDLDGDGEFLQGDIEVVRPDFKLVQSLNAKKRQGVSNVFLKSTNTGRVSGLDLVKPGTFTHSQPLQLLSIAGSSDDNTSFDKSFSDSTSRYPESFGNNVFGNAGLVYRDYFCDVNPFAEKFLRIGTASNLDASLPEPARNGFPFDGKLTSKLFSSRASEVTLDEIVEVRRFHYDGPVYDMETSIGYFSCGIGGATVIIRNCRCQPVPVYKREWASLRARGYTISKFNEQGHPDEKLLLYFGPAEYRTNVKLEPVAQVDDKLVRLSEVPYTHDESTNQLDGNDDSAEAMDMDESTEQHDYCSTQFDLPHVVGLKVMGMADRIKDDDLADKGREDDPHVTVVYGLHDESACPIIGEILKATKPIEATLRRSSVFEKDDCDVVKLNIDSPDLHRLHDKIVAECECTLTHPYYQPHVTLAYVKKGEGQKYANMLDLEGTKVKLSDFTFRNRDESATQFKMGGGPSRFSEIYHGPTPPSETGWQQIQPGPRGGKRWKKVEGAKAGSTKPVGQKKTVNEPAKKSVQGAPGSQLSSSQRDTLRKNGMVGTFPPANVPVESIKINNLSKSELAHKPLMQWDQKTKSGRISRQYRYTQEFHDRNAASKFNRVMAVEPHLEKAKKELDKRVADRNRDAGERDAAAIASIIAETGLRPTDNDESIRHGHYGIASLQARHCTIAGNEIKLNFIGKEGVRNKTTVRNPVTVAWMKERLKGLSGKDFIWDCRSSHAGAVLKEVVKSVGGPDNVMLKDLRTIKATQTARAVVNNYKGPPPPLVGDEKKDTKIVVSAILSMSAMVAKVLNNTPSQARDNYIHPEVFKQWLNSVQKKKR